MRKYVLQTLVTRSSFQFTVSPLENGDRLSCDEFERRYTAMPTNDQQIDWFCLQNGRYIDLLADADGITRSRIFPGLWLDRTSLLNGDMQKVLSVLQLGISSKEHNKFEW